jgi:hypothetical protein
MALESACVVLLCLQKREADPQMSVRTERKAGLFRHGQPLAHLVGSKKKVCGIFAANSADCAGFADSSG